MEENKINQKDKIEQKENVPNIFVEKIEDKKNELIVEIRAVWENKPTISIKLEGYEEVRNVCYTLEAFLEEHDKKDMINDSPVSNDPW